MTINLIPAFTAFIFYFCSLGLFKRSGYDWAKGEWKEHIFSTALAALTNAAAFFFAYLAIQT